MRTVFGMAVALLVATALLGQQTTPPDVRPAQNSAPAGAGFSVTLPVSQAELEIRQELRALQLAHAKTDDAGSRDEIRSKMTVLLNKQFGILTALDARQLDEVEGTLTRLRAQYKDRVEAKLTLVESHLTGLLNEAEGLHFFPQAINVIRSMPSGGKISPASRPRD